MKFTEEHLWLREEDGNIVVGVTPFGVSELGEIAYIELPEEGDTVVKDDEVAVVESDKTTSDILAPIGGEIVDVNTALLKNTSLLLDDPVGDGWLFTIAPEDLDDMEDYMTEGDYKKFVG
ncbi:glycine cleavage system H protein [Loktanella fryxellensis]|uniref:Glycine cleavage system H protein n=1 Tax=Loktanella fryxellensis TaxID=245187 RepID=A0A1H8G8K6_9RHOB|nr:glycine cleavage system protein GcvH [Loktanella fryxellensis]SEN40080.1 glycine cleavage system H protein [Loktanella fryxellensis]